MKIDAKLTHKRETRVVIDRHELRKIIAEHARKGAGLPRCEDDEAGAWPTTAKVTLEDETEGSPSYVVGTKAVIVLTEDMSGEPGKAFEVVK